MPVTVKGMNTIQNNLKGVVKSLSKDSEQALQEVGQRGVGITKANTPVQSGRLRQSMDYDVKNETVTIGTNMVYAVSVEFRSKNGSQGFFLRSFNQLVPIAKKVFQQVMGVK